MNNKTSLHFYGSEVISGTEDEKPNIMTNGAPIALISGSSKGFWSCEPGTVGEDQMYMRIILWSFK